MPRLSTIGMTAASLFAKSLSFFVLRSYEAASHGLSLVFLPRE